MKRIAIAVLLTLPALSAGADPDAAAAAAFARALAKTDGRVAELERQVADLRKDLAALAAAPAPAAPPKPEVKVELTYAEAYRLSLADGKPLVVWVGGDFCPECVRDSAKEFRHVFVDSFPGVTAPAIVVAVRDGNDIVRVGDVTWWITGDKEFGHLPSIRGAIRRWAERRAAARAGATGFATGGQFAYSSGFAMMSSYSAAPRVRVMRSSGCASCGR